MMVLQEHLQPPSTADGKQTPPFSTALEGGLHSWGERKGGEREGGKLGGRGGEGGGSVSSIHPCQEGRHAASGISNLVTKIKRAATQ